MELNLSSMSHFPLEIRSDVRRRNESLKIWLKSSLLAKAGEAKRNRENRLKTSFMPGEIGNQPSLLPSRVHREITCSKQKNVSLETVAPNSSERMVEAGVKQKGTSLKTAADYASVCIGTADECKLSAVGLAKRTVDAAAPPLPTNEHLVGKPFAVQDRRAAMSRRSPTNSWLHRCPRCPPQCPPQCRARCMHRNPEEMIQTQSNGRLTSTRRSCKGSRSTCRKSRNGHGLRSSFRLKRGCRSATTP